MMRSDDPRRRALALARFALARPRSPFPELPPRLVLVDVFAQSLSLIEAGAVTVRYAVSTAAAGIGGESGSHRTPPGWHRIHRRIGQGEPPGTVFESREPTVRLWRPGDAGEEDLILTRVLTLEGLEDGVNRGPGRDSLERYIYLHGTNHEAAIGEPRSHGCVRLRNADVAALFERVAEGDPVVIVGGDPVVPDPVVAGRFHYAGVAGSGMSALAQFQVMSGGRASGSDRAFDCGERGGARRRLEEAGIAIHPQDGSGVGGDCAALVLSTAVEEQVPDVVAARANAVPVVHRSELLAHFVARHRTIAVTGTSGKSTVVAMIFEILEGAGRSPSVITGGDLLALQARGLWGNAWRGGSDLLVVEADESDGSVVRYRPAVGVVLNLQRDHWEMDRVADMFEIFSGQVREALVVGEQEDLAPIAGGADVFGFGASAAVRGANVDLGPDASRFEVDGTLFRLPVPGLHNVANALAAIAACRAVGVAPAEMLEPLARFQGVGRRFHVVGRTRGVEVVDDFAHNPAKIEAAVRTARRRGRRVLAVYQPHGYGPTRFLRRDYVESFARVFGPEDRLWLLEIFYAGGSAVRDISSRDLVAEIAAQGVGARFAESRREAAGEIAAAARAGDVVLVMGARDPSLSDFARDVLAALGGAAADAGAAAGAPPGEAPRS
jgi:UDP-N-acetylmuramate--alanine ligase